jgi:hypothetical protein
MGCHQCGWHPTAPPAEVPAGTLPASRTDQRASRVLSRRSMNDSHCGWLAKLADAAFDIGPRSASIATLTRPVESIHMRLPLSVVNDS